MQVRSTIASSTSAASSAHRKLITTKLHHNRRTVKKKPARRATSALASGRNSVPAMSSPSPSPDVFLRALHDSLASARDRAGQGNRAAQRSAREKQGMQGQQGEGAAHSLSSDRCETLPWRLSCKSCPIRRHPIPMRCDPPYPLMGPISVRAHRSLRTGPGTRLQLGRSACDKHALSTRTVSSSSSSHGNSNNGDSSNRSKQTWRRPGAA